ncbi:hypothetical protein MSAN_02357100 [Mycena sanguinolenta]|uniref:Tc1-like transposase DDE domain-containing protein n=1 Tax=Mycena sanguinolenta TaxID=230812 RepID=A0A8H6X6G5_9AGAR|nr:hypothetical protein MSAN_02357100 [Mycena sanguinolenta]
MVGDFVSDVYGWMRSKKPGANGEYKRAWNLFKAGKTREGYQKIENILDQATVAMDILEEDYSDKKHVLAYDNATIHTACAPDALSAVSMTLKPSNNFNKVKGSDDIACCVRMRDETFKDRTPQCLYYSDGSFKGIKVLIAERRAKGHDLPDPDAPAPDSSSAKKIKAQCGNNFKCRHTTSTQFCLKKVLYMEPDFQAQKSILEEHCDRQGFEVIFFPKYHPELNFIEQCWGYAKRIYRMCPPSSKEEDLTRNMLEALDAVPLASMRRFATRSSRFADAYFRGLDGVDAAWANKKYRGHSTLPLSYLDDLRQRKTRR